MNNNRLIKKICPNATAKSEGNYLRSEERHGRSRARSACDRRKLCSLQVVLATFRFTLKINFCQKALRKFWKLQSNRSFNIIITSKIYLSLIFLHFSFRLSQILYFVICFTRKTIGFFLL